MDEYEKWVKEVCDFIWPTWHGYAFDLDSVDSKALPYYKNGVFSRDATDALLHEHTQIVEAAEAESDSTTTFH
ncbi:MAG: hypothetical protein DBP02_10105 [gamma proteobacterium symbiont of Ctena orbiculata]|nr:MAG: hypothetical protein DBP02_10105 [gamma proteobacterium symbiont of Ctena orbiculata]